MLKAVFFDLDGTLLPMDLQQFIEVYIKLLCKKMMEFGYEPKLLAKTVYNGTMKMYGNDGSKSNEEIFWDYFASIYGNEKLKDKSIVDEFYLNEFRETKLVCEENPFARKIIDFCKENNIEVYLTTNPFFPRQGTLTRMEFVDLKDDDFRLITTYENSRFCKPNSSYFKEILEDYNLDPNEVIMFGNDALEDGECSLMCGIKCYMVGDYIINKEKAKHEFIHVKMNEVIETIKKHM